MQKIIFSLIVLSITINLGFTQKPIKTENVIWITYDGLRWQEVFEGADSLLINHEEYNSAMDEMKVRFWAKTPVERRKKLLPFFWSTLVEEGQLYGNRILGSKVDCSNNRLFSYPGYNEILTGFADPRIKSNDKVPNKNKTLLEFANNLPTMKGKVAAFGSWDVFPYIINEGRSRVPVNAGFEVAKEDSLSEKELFLNELQPQVPSPWTTVRLDAFTHHYAMEYLRKHEPKLLYIAYGETDDFAHDGDYDAYLRSAYQTDAFIKEIWEYVQSHPVYKDKTTLLISTDHGRGTVPLDTWKGHGEKIPDSRQIWIAAIGPDTPSWGEVELDQTLYQNQLAATVAKLLRIEYTNMPKPGEAIESIFAGK